MSGRFKIAKKARAKVFDTFAAPARLILDHGEGIIP